MIVSVYLSFSWFNNGEQRNQNLISSCVSRFAQMRKWAKDNYYLISSSIFLYFLFVCITFQVAWTMTFFSTTGWHLIVSRAVCGIANAGAYVITPMYIREISEDHIRGSLGSLVSLLQNIGILSMFVMGTYLNYNLTLWIIVPLPLLLMLALFKAPESPSFLAKQGKTKVRNCTLLFVCICRFALTSRDRFTDILPQYTTDNSLTGNERFH